MRKAGLYIHIPFCLQKCSYCDFFSVRASQFKDILSSPLSSFVLRLTGDIKFQAGKYGITEWDTVYIGGGTPSLLSPDDLYYLASQILTAQKNPPKEFTVEINPEDLRVDTYRSSGAGGQHINKTSSAVRITHIPTGVVVQCQSQRSQFQNKEVAMQMLKAKLFMLKQQAHVDKLSDIRGDVKDVAWGSQIRSYILQPYTMVKDHRTGCESGNAQAVLDGDIDKFIIAYLTWDSLGRPDGSQQDMGDIE